MKKNDFSFILTKKRIASGLTQTQVANSLYMSRSTYNHYERGFRIPSIETLIQLSDLFNVDPLILLTPLIYKNKEHQHEIHNAKINETTILLSAQEAAMLSNYKLLDSHQKQVIDNLIASLTNP